MALVCQWVVSQLQNHLPIGGVAVKMWFFKHWGFRRAFRNSERMLAATKWHLCAKGVFRRGGYEVAKPFRSGYLGVAKLFRSQRPFSQGPFLGCEILQTIAFPCFWAPLDSQLPSFTSFDIPPDFDHPNTYVKSKQSKIKALKSKLKQVIKQNKKIWTS